MLYVDKSGTYSGCYKSVICLLDENTDALPWSLINLTIHCLIGRLEASDV